jgi:EAL domain-containing protein (putative c-di-GMP-specific phosphodiesterase class I)
VAALPITELKLDRSLIAGAENERMVSAVARMGQTLGLRLVAKGVETEAELRLVRSLGYDAAQGYLLSRPIMAAKVAAHLRTWQQTPAVAPESSPPCRPPGKGGGPRRSTPGSGPTRRRILRP